MAPKKHKAKKSSIKKEGAVDDAMSHHRRQRWPWSELPPTNSSIHPSILERNICHNNLINSAPAITKSWLPTTTRCDAHQRPQLRHVATSTSNMKTSEKVPHNRHFLGDSSIAEAAYEMPKASHWCLLKSDTDTKFHPPPTIPSNRFHLLGPKLQLNGVFCPNAPSSGLTVNYSVYRYVTPNSHWYTQISIRHECTTADPFDAKKRLMEFTSVVHYQGKFYATSLQGALAVMQVTDMRLKITAMSATRAVPSVSSRFFKEYLFQMKGEILMVFLIHQKSLEVVDHVEVFQLDLDRIGWIKVERLRGKTLFLKERCIWVDSVEFGCRDDRVYFTQGSEMSWRVYDFYTRCISPVGVDESGI